MALVAAEVNSLNEIEAVKCPHGGRCKVCVDTWNHRCEFFSGCDQTGGQTTIDCRHEHAGKDWHWDIHFGLTYE